MIGLSELRAIHDGAPFRLDDAARRRVEESAASVGRLLASGKAIYGINTGFGLLAQTRIPADRLGELQRNLVLSHCAGVGKPLDESVVRLVLALKIASLGRGHSGVRPEVVEMLETLLAAGALPAIPSKGSVGASGDLAPLAHMTAALMGLGEMHWRGATKPAGEVLQGLGLAPLEPGPKEGLALLNGTQVSTALALAALLHADRLFAAAILAGAMSVDALMGSTVPFDPRIHEARGHKGQIEVATVLRRLLEGSAINAAHAACDKVQDPYSLRCQPQVMGAVRDVLRMVAGTLVTEANAATDNPLIFAGDDSALSGGNFHAEPVAFAADMLANAVAEIAAVSERRTAILVDPKMSGLPAFLVENSGLHSGFMIAQVTAAALVAENRMLAHPASVDSIPTSANQEDHVSMATHGARRSLAIVRNSADVVAIELLAAAQGIDFRAPLASSPPLMQLHRAIREQVPHLDGDRMPAPDIARARGLIESRLPCELCALPDLV